MGLGVLGELFHRCPLHGFTSWAMAQILSGFERHEVVNDVDKIVARSHEYRLTCGSREKATAIYPLQAQVATDWHAELSSWPVCDGQRRNAIRRVDVFDKNLRGGQVGSESKLPGVTDE